MGVGMQVHKDQQINLHSKAKGRHIEVPVMHQ